MKNIKQQCKIRPLQSSFQIVTRIYHVCLTLIKTSIPRSFACGIHEKLADMIEGLATPVEMKLKLIPIFQYMYHDASTAQRVTLLHFTSCFFFLPPLLGNFL